MKNAQNNLEQPSSQAAKQPSSQAAKQPRRSAWSSARESAIEAARRNALHECPYRDERWRSFWFREFEKAQQLEIFGVAAR